MTKYLVELKKSFRLSANPANSVGMKAYMLHQFDFYGIKTPERDKIVKSYIRANPLHTLKELNSIIATMWAFKEREWQYAAIDVYKHHRILWQENAIDLIESCLIRKSWWDTVDGIGSDWLPKYFSLFPEKQFPVTQKWNRSTNIWLQRSSILFQRSYKKNTNTQLLAEYILRHQSSKEFFIQKSIGWALREYSKTNPNWVKSFVESNDLAPLSKREALKRLKS